MSRSLIKLIEELEGQLERSQTEAPPKSEDFAQGDEIYEMEFSFRRRKSAYDFDETTQNKKYRASWNDIFSRVSPLMIDEASEDSLKKEVTAFIVDKIGTRLRGQLDNEVLDMFEVSSEFFHTIAVQLRALGFITKSVRNRSVKDKETYWMLSPYGETLMTRLRAIRR